MMCVTMGFWCEHAHYKVDILSNTQQADRLLLVAVMENDKIALENNDRLLKIVHELATKKASESCH